MVIALDKTCSVTLWIGLLYDGRVYALYTINLSCVIMLLVSSFLALTVIDVTFSIKFITTVS